MKKSLLYFAAGTLPFAGVWAIIGVVQPGNAYGFLWVALWALAAYGGWRFATDERLRKNTRIYAWLLSAVYLALQVYGYQLNLHGGGTLRSIALCAVAALGLAGGLAWPVALFLQADAKHASAKTGSGKLVWLVCFGIILLGWLPVFLAYYPGIFRYDAGTQLSQYLSQSITSHHPPLHTIWLGSFYCLGETVGSYNLAFALHIFSQLLLMAIILSYALARLFKTGLCRSWCYITASFTAVFPVHSVLAISATKDVCFTGFFVLVVVELLCLFKTPQIITQPWFWIKFVLFTVLFCLMRSNAIYALALSLPFLVILIQKNGPKAFFLLLSISFIFSFTIYKLVDSHYETPRMERFNEMTSVPRQQLCRIATLKNAAYDDVLAIKQFFDSPGECYDPHLSDRTKECSLLKTPEDERAFLLCGCGWLESTLQPIWTLF